MASNYLLLAKDFLEKGEFAKAILALNAGRLAGDKSCLMVMYYFPKEVSYQEKLSYLRKHFDEFELDITFDSFLSSYIYIGSPIQKEYSIQHGDDFSNIDLINYVFQKEFNIPESYIKNFWEQCNESVFSSNLLKIINNVLLIDFDLALMSKEEFEKKKDSISEMLYVRYVYMTIDEGKITVDSNNYKKLSDSKYAFYRFEKIIDVAEDKEYFKNVIAKNDSFILSVKKTFFSGVVFDKRKLKEVIDGLTKSMSQFTKRMTDEQMKEVNESASIHERIGRVVGKDFLFTSD